MGGARLLLLPGVEWQRTIMRVFQKSVGLCQKNAQASHSDLSQLSAVSLRPEVFDPVIG